MAKREAQATRTRPPLPHGIGTDAVTLRPRLPPRPGHRCGTGNGPSEAGLQLHLEHVTVVDALRLVTPIVVGESAAHLVAPHPVVDDAADLQRRPRLAPGDAQRLAAAEVR